MRTLQKILLNLSVLAAPALGLAASSGAQEPTFSSDLALRSSGSLSLVQARPQGELGKHIGFGYGLDGAYLLRLDRAGVLSLRADLGVVEYGNETKRSALSERVGARVEVNVRTTHYIVPMSVGPQLTWPSGIVRPYVNAGVGGQAFFTESRVENMSDGSAIASTTNHSDITASWTSGAGVYVPIRAGRSNVLLDIGVQYVNGGRSQYLAPGSITDLPGGKISVAPFETTTHLIVLRFGAKVGL